MDRYDGRTSECDHNRHLRDQQHEKPDTAYPDRFEQRVDRGQPRHNPIFELRPDCR